MFGIPSWTKGVLLGVGIAAGFIAISSMSNGAVSWITPATPIAWESSGKFLMIVVIAPIFEELLMRFTLLQVLAQRLPIWVAQVVQAVIFGFAHVAAYSAIGGSAAIVGAIIFGLMAGIAFMATRNILVSIVAHGLINFWIAYKGVFSVV